MIKPRRFGTSSRRLVATSSSPGNTAGPLCIIPSATMAPASAPALRGCTRSPSRVISPVFSVINGPPVFGKLASPEKRRPDKCASRAARDETEGESETWLRVLMKLVVGDSGLFVTRHVFPKTTARVKGRCDIVAVVLGMERGSVGTGRVRVPTSVCHGGPSTSRGALHVHPVIGRLGRT